MRARPELVIVAIGCLLGACSPPEPPLEHVREELAALDQQPLPEGWRPQVALVLSPALVDQLAGVAAADVVIPELVARAALAIEVRARPTLGPPVVALRSSDRCPGCIDVGATVQGDVALASGNARLDVGWRSALTATVSVDGAPGPDGFTVHLVPVESERWAATVELVGVPPGLGALIEPVVESRLQQEIAARVPRSGPIRVATLPAEGPVRLRGMRAYVAEDLVLDLAFSATTAGEVRHLPDPGDGFAVALPAKTLLGLAHGALVREGPYDGYDVEVTQLHLDDGRFELWMRVWKTARRDRWREFVLRGELGLQDGQIAFLPDTVAEVDRESWSTPIDPLIRKRVLDALARGAAVTLPARHVGAIGRGELAVEIVSLEAREDLLTVHGRIAPP